MEGWKDGWRDSRLIDGWEEAGEQTEEGPLILWHLSWATIPPLSLRLLSWDEDHHRPASLGYTEKQQHPVCAVFFMMDSFLTPLGDAELSAGTGVGNCSSSFWLLEYSCLENPMDRGAWLATVHGFAKSQTRLNWIELNWMASLCMACELRMV